MALASFLLLNGTTTVDGLATSKRGGRKATTNKQEGGESQPRGRKPFHTDGTGGKANLNQHKLNFSQEAVNRLGAVVSTRAKLTKEGTVLKDGNCEPATKFMPRFLTQGNQVTYTNVETGLSELVEIQEPVVALLAFGAFGSTNLPTYTIAGEKFVMDLSKEVKHESGNYNYCDVLAEVLGIQTVEQEFFLRDADNHLIRDEEGKPLTDTRIVYNNFDFDIDTTGYFSFHDAKTEIRAYRIVVGEQYAPAPDKQRESFGRTTSQPVEAELEVA